MLEAFLNETTILSIESSKWSESTPRRYQPAAPCCGFTRWRDAIISSRRRGELVCVPCTDTLHGTQVPVQFLRRDGRDRWHFGKLAERPCATVQDERGPSLAYLSRADTRPGRVLRAESNQLSSNAVERKESPSIASAWLH